MRMFKHTGRLVVVVWCTAAMMNGSRAGNDSNKAATGKSRLVRDLERIVHDPKFVAVPQRVFSVNSFGAKGDGRTLDTEAIQKTIDAATAAGGGIVQFRPGTYRAGALFVKSNVELRLDEGVVIQAVQDDALYPRLPTRIAGIEMAWPAALINVYEQKNIKITGKGVIDGNGKYWWNKFKSMLNNYEKRKLRWAVDYDCERVRGVPEFRDIRFSDITVLASGTAIDGTTHADKPFRRFIWQNITFEVESAGTINHAADWKMENVTLKASDGKGFKLQNCVNVELPKSRHYAPGDNP